MAIILFVVFAILIFLIWVDAVPVRKWMYSLRIKLVGIRYRGMLELLDRLDQAEKWIDKF